jgi:hypothetical protein
LGGLIGAAVASVPGKSPSAGPVIKVYWVAFALSTVVAFLVGCAAGGADGAAALGIILVLVFLPLVQLLASILTMIWIVIQRESFPDKKASLAVLGKITLYSFLGALAGIVAMTIGSKMFSQ